MTTTKKTYKCLEEMKSAAKSGVVVNWHNSGYTVKESKSGDFKIICFNGHCSHLSNDYKAEDFYSL